MKVLIIDDMETVLNTISLFIKDELKCEVVTADNGFSGIEKFRAENPDLIITDTQMPGIDGVEVIRAIKKEKKDAKIILKSARFGGEKQAADEGAVFYWYGDGDDGLIKALAELGFNPST